MNPIFQFPRYLLKRQAIALTGKFRVYDPMGNLVMFSEQKMFRLREDIRVYSDEIQNLTRLDTQYFLCFAFIAIHADIFAQSEHLLFAEHHNPASWIIKAELSGQRDGLSLEQVIRELKNRIHIFSLVN